MAISHQPSAMPDRGGASVNAEVSVSLPGRDVLDVVEPLLTLGGEEVLVEVLAERLSNEVVLLELVERLAQVARELVDAQVAALAVAHLVDVLVHRRTRIHLLVDAVEP